MTIVAAWAIPVPERAFPSRREAFPRGREAVAWHRRVRHAGGIDTTTPPFSTRHATTIAVALLVCALAAAVVTVSMWLSGSVGAGLLNDPPGTVAELLCYGVVGAVLIARRPDLPFGWILGLAALADMLVVGVGIPSLVAVDAHRGGELAVWGLGVSVLQWVPAALEGVINVRFPSGRPGGRIGRWHDRALRYGIVIALVGSYLGDSVATDLADVLGHPLPTRRVIDGTWITPIGDASVVLVPLVILLGLLAGIGVIVRCVRASGIERKQLQWRAAGAAIALVLFPFIAFGMMPPFVGAIEPLVFVATLLIPVLRYQLWSGDPVRRRRKVGVLVSRRTLIEAQEDERRRLRRDLHDGLGPLLTGLRLNLDAVQTQLTTDPDKALEYLITAREVSAEVITDLRGLVYGLRPPALDELGLAGALRVQLEFLTKEARLELELDTGGGDGLPAAVESAIYRTATEAVTNVLRHSDARRCRVAIVKAGADVVLTVDDDGHLAGTWHPGVGLSSMRERAVELGGSLTAGSGPDGFQIRAVYPRRHA